jgi:rhodanese-related sulfurtransferase
MANDQQCTEASPDECRRAITEEAGCRIIDVRTPAEYAEGHLDNAINIDFYAPGFREQLVALDRERPYVVYCRKGMRGAKAMSIMKETGFRRVYNMSGGIENWNRLGLSLQRR